MNVSADFTELVSNPWQWTIDKREIFQEAGKRKVQESWFSEIGLGDTLERRRSESSHASEDISTLGTGKMAPILPQTSS